MRTAVVLPAPFGPSRTVIVPAGATDREIDERGLVAEAATDVLELHGDVGTGGPRGSGRPSTGSVVTRAILAYRHDADP